MPTTGTYDQHKNERVILGALVVKGMTVRKQITPPAKTVTTTLTAAEIMSGIITANQGGGAAAVYTMPTGALLDAAMKANGTPMDIDDAFEFIVVNISTVAAEDVTIAGGAGTTAVGNMTVASNAAVTDIAQGIFRVRKTAAGAFSFYRIG